MPSLHASASIGRSRSRPDWRFNDRRSISAVSSGNRKTTADHIQHGIIWCTTDVQLANVPQSERLKRLNVRSYLPVVSVRWLANLRREVKETIKLIHWRLIDVKIKRGNSCFSSLATFLCSSLLVLWSSLTLFDVFVCFLHLHSCALSFSFLDVLDT